MATEHPILHKCDSFTQRLTDWEQTRAAIKGKNEVVKIITLLPSPLYNNYTSCLNSNDPIAFEVYKQQQTTNRLRMEAYWARGRYYNASGRTHTSLNGMLWSKQPEVELNSQIQYIESSANGGNVSLNDFVRDLSSEDLEVGRGGVLVDMPQMEGRPTIAEVENGFSARFVGYKAESIFYWRLNPITNKLEEVRLFEIKEVKVDNFNYEVKQYVRRLVLIDGVYINELYDDGCKLIQSTQPRANGRALNYIPFQFFGAVSNTPDIDNPPLYDLAQVNLGHFVLDCDNRDNLHYHGQGMTNIYTDMTPQEFMQKNPAGLDVGAKGRNMFSQGDKVEVLQIAATGAIAEEMMRDEKRMVSLGAQLVQDVNTNVTLGAKEMEFGASVSQLKQISYNISEGITRCLNWADVFMGGAGEGNEFKLNTDFVTDNLTPEMLNHYFAAVQGGVIPKSIYYEALRGVGATTLDNDEITELAAQEGADLQGESEELARLRAENEALREQNGE